MAVVSAKMVAHDKLGVESLNNNNNDGQLAWTLMATSEELMFLIKMCDTNFQSFLFVVMNF
jgi:hypothetical protein